MNSTVGKSRHVEQHDITVLEGYFNTRVNTKLHSTTTPIYMDLNRARLALLCRFNVFFTRFARTFEDANLASCA